MRITAILFAIAVLRGQTSAPTFSQYHADARKVDKPIAPILRSKRQRTFRTRIREAAAEGPNFAGQYKIAEWGCGAGCASFAIIDEVSGTVYDPPFSGVTIKVSDKYEGGDPGYDYKPDSRLLVARGCPDEADCGTHYYEWIAPTLKLLRRVPSHPRP